MTSGANPTQSGTSPSKGKNSIRQYIVWFVIGLIVALALAASAGVSTPSSSFPITVDGSATTTTTSTTTTSEYSTSTTSAKSIGYTSGSLYSNPGTNLATFVVTDNLAGQKGFWFCGKIESTKVQDLSQASHVGAINLTVTRIINKVPTVTPAAILIDWDGSSFTYSLKTGVDSTALPVSNFGIQVATKLTNGVSVNGVLDNTFPGQKALVTEFAIPLAAGAKTTLPTIYPVDAPYRINSVYSLTDVNTAPIQITDGLVKVNTVIVRNKTSYLVDNDAFYVPGKTVLDIGNIGSLTPNKGGVVQVVVLNISPAITNAQVVTAIQDSLISIRDFDRDPSAESQLNFLNSTMNGPGDFFTAGAHPRQFSLRTNTDGTRDLVLQFLVDDLVNQQTFYWGPGTKNVELAGVIGSQYIASKAVITINNQ